MTGSGHDFQSPNAHVAPFRDIKGAAKLPFALPNGAKGAENFNPDRFELLIGMLFGLANDGLVDKKGRPFPLQAAVIAKEFADLIVFTKPPPAFQRVALGILAPLGHLLGYRAIIPSYRTLCLPRKPLLRLTLQRNRLGGDCTPILASGREKWQTPPADSGAETCHKRARE
jgi:hypothetical protein